MRRHGPASRRLLRALASVLVLGAGALTAAPAGALPADPAPVASGTAGAGRTAPGTPATDTLPLTVSVTEVSPQVLRPGEPLTLTATLRNDGDHEVTPARASVRIYRYRMAARDDLSRWADSGSRAPLGDVAATERLDQPLPPGASATVTVTVPPEAVGLLRTADAWGPRGVTFDVADSSGRVGIDRTFLLWASDDDVPTARVGVLAPVVGPPLEPAATEARRQEAEGEDGAAATPGPTATDEPTADPGAEPEDTDPDAVDDPAATADDEPGDEPTVPAGTGPDDSALEAATGDDGRLARLLQATADHPVVSWAVDPALVQRTSTSAGDARSWLTALEEAARGREVLRLPWADPDLGAIAHAGGQASDLLGLALTTTGTSQSSPLWSDARPVLLSADDVPDLETAALAATDGAGAPLVTGPGAMPPTRTGTTPDAAVALTTAGGDLSALVPDEALSDLLATPSATQPGATPATAAQRVLAETAVLARSAGSDGVTVLARTPRDWDPTTAVADAQLSALESAPWVDTTSVAGLLDDPAGDVRRDELPATSRTADELTPAWVNALDGGWRAAQAFASVVQDPAALLDGLGSDILTPLSVAWRADPQGRAQAVQTALAEAQARQRGLTLLLNQQVTVISRTSQIRVVVRNDLDQDAMVRVEVRPQKGCLQTTRSGVVPVAARQQTAVPLSLRATANCDVDVTVSLVAENGRELASPVRFRARVAPTVESVGTVVLAVLLAVALVLGIWRTVRRGQTSRRGARVAAEAEAEGTDPAEDGERGPDDGGDDGPGPGPGGDGGGTDGGGPSAPPGGPAAPPGGDDVPAPSDGTRDEGGAGSTARHAAEPEPDTAELARRAVDHIPRGAGGTVGATPAWSPVLAAAATTTSAATTAGRVDTATAVVPDGVTAPVDPVDGPDRGPVDATPPVTDLTPDPTTAAAGDASAPREPGLGRSSLVMASGTAVSRVLGVLNTSLLGWAIGLTGNAADAFSVANKLPNTLYLLIAGGVLNAVLVPQVVRAYRRADGQQYVNRLLTVGLVFLAGVTVVLTTSAPLWVRLYSDFPNPRATALATALAFCVIPQLFFYGLYSLLGQVLNARGSFGPYMWAPVVNNIVFISGLLLFVHLFGRVEDGSRLTHWTTAQTLVLGGSATAGIIAQALVLLVPLYRSGFRYRPQWGLRGSGLGSAGRVATWTFAGLLVGQVGVWAVSVVASAASGDAGNGVYDRAFLIFMLPHSLVTVSLATALFTRLSGRAAAGDTAGVRSDLSLGLRTVGVFTVLATTGIAVLAFPLGRLLFPDRPDASVHALAAAVVALIAGLVAFGMWSLCQRVYYAYEDARSMFPMQVVMAVIVVAGTFAGRALLEPAHWVVAACASMAVSYVVGAAIALVALRRRLHGIDGRRVLVLHVKTVTGALPAAAVGLGFLALLGPLDGALDALVACVGGAVLMTGVYVGVLAALRTHELTALTGPVLRRLRRR